MKYYKYIDKTKDFIFTYEVHKAIQNCKYLAISKYKSNWEDALDDAYFHVLEHFDESKGSLENYAARIVSTIYLNKYDKEIGSDIVYDLESNKQAVKQNLLEDPYEGLLEDEEVEYCTELKECIKYLIPYFIKDYEFFMSKDASSRKLSYSGLFDKFSANAIKKAMDVLVKKHYDDVKELNAVSKKSRTWNFSPDRYKKSLDKSLVYICRIGDIVKCRLTGINRTKYLYMLDIQDLLLKLFEMFYSEQGAARKNIGGVDVYCTLSGELVCDKEELFFSIEKDVIGSMLALRSNFRVIHYSAGKELILSSTNMDEKDILVRMFNTGIRVPLKKLILGSLEK